MARLSFDLELARNVAIWDFWLRSDEVSGSAALRGSRSKESLAKNLKEVLQLLQQEEDEGFSSNKEETNSSEEDDPFYQNEDDCFGISLNDD